MQTAPRRELTGYLVLMATWFGGFGLQTVLFPYLAANVLGVDGGLLGLAQMSLSAPSVVLLLFGGALAERADARGLILKLHLVAAAPPFVLGIVSGVGEIHYWMLIAYGLSMGVASAFMMPARDALLNLVVDRRTDGGRPISLQTAVALASLAQFGGQIAGLVIGGFASVVGPTPLLIFHGVSCAVGGLAALMLARTITRPRGPRGSTRSAIAEGIKVTFGDPVLKSMTLIMAGVGVFVIGAFLVVIPLLARDLYNGDSATLRDVFVTFWVGAFVSSVALTRMKPAERPGQWLLASQTAGAILVLMIAFKPSYLAFLLIVFGWGLGAGISITMSRSIVQGAAPAAVRARVLSVYQLGFMGGAPLGAVVMGLVAQGLQGSPQLTGLVSAVGLGALVIWGVFASPLPSLGRAATPLAEPLIPEPHDETEDEDIEDEARDVAR
jgi:MFS family permease